MSEDESRPRIVVRDRRAFTREGERREPDPAAPEGDTPAESAPAESVETTPEAERPADDPRFQQLVQLLHMQALMLLERAPGKDEDANARRKETLAGLEATISLLEMLQAKTRDRLGDADGRYLAQVLFQLRMTYMEVTRGTAGKVAAPE